MMGIDLIPLERDLGTIVNHIEYESALRFYLLAFLCVFAGLLCFARHMFNPSHSTLYIIFSNFFIVS